jgi:hypothetical protein
MWCCLCLHRVLLVAVVPVVPSQRSLYQDCTADPFKVFCWLTYSWPIPDPFGQWFPTENDWLMLKKIKVNGKDYPIYYGKIIQMFQTTNQMIYKLWFFRICLNSVRGGDPCGCPCRQPSCHMGCWTWEVRRGMTFWVGTAPIDDNLTGTMDDNCGLSPIFLGQYCRFSPLSQFWLLQLMTILLGLSGANLQLIVFCPLSRYQTQHFFFVLLH